MKTRISLLLLVLYVFSTAAAITTPHEALGFNIGDDYQVANYSELESYWKKLASESDRMRLVEIGKTGEGRTQYMAVVSSSANIGNLAKYKAISQRLAHAEGLSQGDARQLAREGKTVIWIDGGLHANETVGSQQLIETAYQLVSRSDEETLRLLNDSIVLMVEANPDGQDIVANWYMREKDPLKRSLNGVPRLYNKYAGHDDNRDFYISNLAETRNMNRQMFTEWFPQIVYDHHQTGPAGAVIFMPPFRDPFNYNLDPLVPLEIEMVGAAMHSRLVAEGKGGSAMRSGSNYSTWWNGGLRTVTYFHNMIGLLTEIIGGPTPVDIPLVPEKQLATGDWPLPIPLGKWHYRQSIDYEVTNNYAVLDFASRYRETLLFNIWRMGMNSIERGSRDNWTITPKRLEALKAAAPSDQRGPAVPATLYNSVLHDPAYRDPRGYIISAAQADFPTATKFVNALLINGIDVMRATAPFSVAGKPYPAGSYAIKTAQAFRPHILDMFEPQDHPNDLRYPGGPPIAPYDLTGWTLAMQMGVQFDRVLDSFGGPFVKVQGLLPIAPAQISGVAAPAGWLLSHQQNDSFTLTNRLLRAGCDVYWTGRTGAVWVPASPQARKIVEEGAKQSGVGVEARASAPAGSALKLKPVRIGLYDQHGGLSTAGWTRFVLEQFDFPFEIAEPETLETGGLKGRFDVLILVDGAVCSTRASSGCEKTLPEIRRFLEAGGSVVAIGSSTAIGQLLGVPISNQLAGLGQDKFFIPGSLLKMKVDNTNPLAFGMPDTADVFFDNSPVFRLLPDAAKRKTSAVSWFSGTNVLASGWALGQQYLNGGTAIAEATVGKGKLILIGPEVAFRAQPHGTFKFLFNAVYYGNAQPVDLR